MIDNKDKRLVKLWTINFNDGRKLEKVATIDQGPRKESMCEGCSAPCCKGIFYPILTKEELASKKFKTTFIPAPDWLKELVPKVRYIATLDIGVNGCPYHDHETNLCTIWPECPNSCLSYDCRNDDRDEIKEFVKSREEEWQRL